MNEQISITVFTPTYNRAYTLKKLYDSLKKQSYKNFEWLIYDDGSIDNTRELIKRFEKEDIIKIRYYYSENYGKHVAINRATDLANGELFFIVDSDDYLTDNSLQLIVKVWTSIPTNKSQHYIGVGGRRLLLNRSNKRFNFNTEYYDADAIKFNLIDKNIQDKAEVYRTDVLKMYKFPEFNGENFMTEAVVWYKVAQDGYKIRWFNEDIYVCEYLDDGLTANFYNKRIGSIRSTCDSYNKLSSFNLPLKYRLRYKVNYFRYGFKKYKLSYLLREMLNKELTSISVFIGYFIHLKDKLLIRD